MPRLYDHSHNPEVSTKDYIWSVYKEPRHGRGEISYIDLWGPAGMFVMDGLGHQFKLSVPKGTSPYDNGIVDPVFEWLNENTTGKWHWHESETNNNRSVGTDVYIEADSDIEAFRAAWGSIFEYNAGYTDSNREWLAAEQKAACENVLPEHVRTSTLMYGMLSMDETTAGWFDGVAERSDFAERFRAALDRAVVSISQEKPSQYGPRLPDGTWVPGIVDAFRETGAWIRERAPDAVRAAVSDFSVDDEALMAAIGPLAPMAAAEQAFPSP